MSKPPSKTKQVESLLPREAWMTVRRYCPESGGGYIFFNRDEAMRCKYSSDRIEHVIISPAPVKRRKK